LKKRLFSPAPKGDCSVLEVKKPLFQVDLE
jgi:hypothetical protein